MAPRNLGASIRVGKHWDLPPFCRASVDARSLKREARATGPGFERNATRGRDAYATFLNALVTPLLIGSAVSAASFCAAAVSSLVCSVAALDCLGACAGG